MCFCGAHEVIRIFNTFSDTRKAQQLAYIVARKQHCKFIIFYMSINCHSPAYLCLCQDRWEFKLHIFRNKILIFSS